MDEREIELVVERLLNRVEQANTHFLTEIGKSVSKLRELKPNDAFRLANILKYGENYNDIVRKISKYMNMNIQDVNEILSNFAKKDSNFYEKFYKYRNIEMTPFEQNRALNEQIEAYKQVMKTNLYSFTRPNVLGYTIRDINNRVQFYGLKETYNRVIDEALLNIGQGKENFDSSMARILREIGGSGLKKVDYASGRTMRLDSAVRMEVLDGIRNLHNANQELFGEEFDANMVEVTHHLNSAPDHIDTIDGKQFALIDKIKEQISKGIEKEIKYEDIQENRVRVKDKWYYDFNYVNNNLKRQVSSLNCYHYTYVGILGVNEPQFTEEELKKDKENNLKGCIIDGKHYTLYEATQIQRQIERNIRQQKDIQIIGKNANNKLIVDKAQNKISQLTNKYKQISKESGLPTKINRLKVSQYKRINTNKMK